MGQPNYPNITSAHHVSPGLLSLRQLQSTWRRIRRSSARISPIPSHRRLGGLMRHLGRAIGRQSYIRSSAISKRTLALLSCTNGALGLFLLTVPRFAVLYSLFNSNTADLVKIETVMSSLRKVIDYTSVTGTLITISDVASIVASCFAIGLAVIGFLGHVFSRRENKLAITGIATGLLAIVCFVGMQVA